MHDASFSKQTNQPITNVCTDILSLSVCVSYVCLCACKTHVLFHSEHTRFSIFGQVVCETHTHTQTYIHGVYVCGCCHTFFSLKLLYHSACRFDDYIFASLCSIFPFVKRNHRKFCSFFFSFFLSFFIFAS